jgi:Nucleotide modification associated domain 2
MIRSTPSEGDIVIGFAANSLRPDNALIYVARVTKKLVAGKYWADVQFASREDCIYEWRQGKLRHRTDARHHPYISYVEHDVGIAPFYSRANALLSDDFSYFGANGTAAYKQDFPLIAAAVERLGQGHRVWHEPALMVELVSLVRETWQMTPEQINGEPTQRTAANCVVDHHSRSHASKPKAVPVNKKC